MQVPVFLFLLTCWIGTISICGGSRVIHYASAAQDQPIEKHLTIGRMLRVSSGTDLTKSIRDHVTQAYTNEVVNMDKVTRKLRKIPSHGSHMKSEEIIPLTREPSVTPPIPVTAAPTSPTFEPTRRPTRRPIGRPTRRPTALKASGMENNSPTPEPTGIIDSSIRVTETLVGITVEEAKDIEFRTAIQFSVVAVLAPYASILSVHDTTVTATPTPSGSSRERSLLGGAGAIVSYTVTATGSSSPAVIAAQLGKAIQSGEYLRLMRESSQLDITSVEAFSSVDLNPSSTEPPSDTDTDTDSTADESDGSSGTTTTALAGGCVAGVLALSAGLAYVYKAKGGKMEKNKYPAVHMQVEGEACAAIEDGDLIPACALKRSQSCMSVPDGYDMIPASKIEEQHSVV